MSAAAVPIHATGPRQRLTASVTGGRSFCQLPNGLVALVSGRAYRVAAVLAGDADRTTGECFPKVRTIAKKLGGCSERTVQRGLRELEEVGYLVTTPYFDRPDASPAARGRRKAGDGSGRQSTNSYRLCPEALGQVIPLPVEPRPSIESVTAPVPDLSPAPPVTDQALHDPESVPGFDPESGGLPPPTPRSAVPPASPPLDDGGGAAAVADDDLEGEPFLDALVGVLAEDGTGDEHARQLEHARRRNTAAVEALRAGGAERLAAGWHPEGLAVATLAGRDLSGASFIDRVLRTRLEDAVPIEPPAPVPAPRVVLVGEPADACYGPFVATGTVDHGDDEGGSLLDVRPPFDLSVPTAGPDVAGAVVGDHGVALPPLETAPEPPAPAPPPPPTVPMVDGAARWHQLRSRLREGERDGPPPAPAPLPTAGESAPVDLEAARTQRAEVLRQRAESRAARRGGGQ